MYIWSRVVIWVKEVRKGESRDLIAKTELMIPIIKKNKKIISLFIYSFQRYYSSTQPIRLKVKLTLKCLYHLSII